MRMLIFESKQGNTALIMASKYKRQQSVIKLLNHNTDVNLQDNKDNTALHSVLLEVVTDTTIKRKNLWYS